MNRAGRHRIRRNTRMLTRGKEIMGVDGWMYMQVTWKGNMFHGSAARKGLRAIIDTIKTGGPGNPPLRIPKDGKA